MPNLLAGSLGTGSFFTGGYPGGLGDCLVEESAATSSNQLWVRDIAYISTGNDFSYLSRITDAYSHKTMGWALEPTLFRREPALPDGIDSGDEVIDDKEIGKIFSQVLAFSGVLYPGRAGKSPSYP